MTLEYLTFLFSMISLISGPSMDFSFIGPFFRAALGVVALSFISAYRFKLSPGFSFPLIYKIEPLGIYRWQCEHAPNFCLVGFPSKTTFAGLVPDWTLGAVSVLEVNALQGDFVKTWRSHALSFPDTRAVL